MKGEAETAALVQKALIPSISRDSPTLATYYRPANETGGDWFFVREHDDRVTLLVGDVTGHGVAPALVTAAIAGAATVLDVAQEDPMKIFREFDRVVQSVGFGQYRMTCLYLHIDKRARSYRLLNAAHPIPMFLQADDVWSPPFDPSSLLGQGQYDWKLVEGKVDPGTFIMMYTDGIVENADHQGQEFSLGRMRRYLRKAPRTQSCQEIVDGLVSATEAHCAGNPAADDCTVVLARVP